MTYMLGPQGRALRMQPTARTEDSAEQELNLSPSQHQLPRHVNGPFEKWTIQPQASSSSGCHMEQRQANRPSPAQMAES